MIAAPLFILSYIPLYLEHSLFGVLTFGTVVLFILSLPDFDREEMKWLLVIFISSFIAPFLIWKNYVLNNKLSLNLNE